MVTTPEPDNLRPYLPRLTLSWVDTAAAQTHREVEGSVVFVDVSGFTKLSERLAARGKVGAEELTDAIGGCFARLLAVAYANGGSLLKFGGDALLLLFTGGEHPVDAARSAAGMRRELRAMGSIQTPGGGVRLRMSVGVHSGTFQFFLVGGSHRELIVTGPAASRTVTMEGTADAGEILISPSTAAAVPARCLGVPKGEGVLLRAEPPGAHVLDPTPLPLLDAEAMAGCVPAALRGHLSAGAVEAEHRSVSVAFLHFDGTDAAIADGGIETVAERLDILVRTVQEAVDREGVCFLGTDVDHDGGKLILTAGAPTATGDDEERMLLALRRIVDADQALPLRIGVNRGPVFAGAIGPPYRRTYTVMGDAVNLAARLMAAAAPGEVFATADVLERSRTRFALRELEPFFVKGKARPVQAWALGAVESGRRSTVGSGLPLFGRDRELGVVADALEQAAAGHGRLIELTGETGIGKTRLLEEVRSRAEGFAAFAAAGEPYGATTPYASFAKLFRQVVGAAPDAGDAEVERRLEAHVRRVAPGLLPWLPVLGLALGLSLPSTPQTEAIEPSFLREVLHARVAEVLASSLQGPVLVTIEDAHWMDEASADLLGALARSLSSTSWLVCTARRRGSSGFLAADVPEATVVALGPLDFGDARALATEATERHPLPPHVLERVVERSGGNPLFLVALAEAAAVAGSADELPDSLENLALAEVDRLPPRDRSLLRAASVMGSTVDRSLAAHVLRSVGVRVDDVAWARLEHFLVPEPDGSLRFRHGVVRDAAYELLSFRRRRELHGLFADAIAARAPDPDAEAELLSVHEFAAGRLARAWRYSRLAGERAAAKYANVDAAGFFERALGCARRLRVGPDDLLPVYVALGGVRERVGDFAAASAAYATARRLAADQPLVTAELLWREGVVRERAGRFAQALRWFTRGLRAVEELSGPDAGRLRAELLVAYASIRQGQGRFSEAIERCMEAIEEGRAAGAHAAVAHAAYLLDWMYRDLGRPADAPYPGLALEIYEEIGDLVGQANVLNNQGMFAYYDGDWAAAVSLYERGRDARERIGDAVNAAFGTANVAEILIDQGRVDEAAPMLRDALRTWRAAGFRQGIAFATGLQGRLALRTGALDEAERLLETARVEFLDVGFMSLALETEGRLAECLVLRGDPRAAARLAADVRTRAESLGGLPVLAAALARLEGYAAAQRGDLDAAKMAFAESLAVARDQQAGFEALLTLEALARVALREGADPSRPLEEAEALRSDLGIIATPAVPLPRIAGVAGPLT